jgi:hypothetical protein
VNHKLDIKPTLPVSKNTPSEMIAMYPKYTKYVT